MDSFGGATVRLKLVCNGLFLVNYRCPDFTEWFLLLKIDVFDPEIIKNGVQEKSTSYFSLTKFSDHKFEASKQPFLSQTIVISDAVLNPSLENG